MSPIEQIGHLADVQIEMSLELDRRVMTIEQILMLHEGSVIRMTRSAGENIDILAGGALLGYGEIVLIENSMGLRITDFNEEV
jgi:flagellar motor switch protein FliN